MSSQRGNVKKGAPKHQNSFAFKHNPKSKKTDRILATPIVGLCQKCHDQMVWRKKYRKYKPLTKPATCNECHQKNVTSAYHALCESCAKARDVCAKCCEKKEVIVSEQEMNLIREDSKKEFELELEGMKEREKRSYLRKLKKEEEEKDEENSDESVNDEEELTLEK